MPNRNISESQVNTIKKLLARGERIADIARYIGRNPRSVSKKIAALRLKTPPPCSPPAPIGRNDFKVDLHNVGASLLTPHNGVTNSRQSRKPSKKAAFT